MGYDDGTHQTDPSKDNVNEHDLSDNTAEVVTGRPRPKRNQLNQQEPNRKPSKRDPSKPQP